MYVSVLWLYGPYSWNKVYVMFWQANLITKTNLRNVPKTTFQLFCKKQKHALSDSPSRSYVNTHAWLFQVLLASQCHLSWFLYLLFLVNCDIYFNHKWLISFHDLMLFYSHIQTPWLCCIWMYWTMILTSTRYSEENMKIRFSEILKVMIQKDYLWKLCLFQ